VGDRPAAYAAYSTTNLKANSPNRADPKTITIIIDTSKTTSRTLQCVRGRRACSVDAGCQPEIMGAGDLSPFKL
jgi:hypothetical protein